MDRARVSNGAKSFLADGLAVTRPFFQIFKFPFVAGTHQPYSDSSKVIYLTEELAYKMFNSSDLVGKVIDFDFNGRSNQGFFIGGILEDPPANSSIKFEFIVPYFSRSNWGKLGFDYLALSQNADVTSFRKKIVDIGKHSPYSVLTAAGTMPKRTESTVIPLTNIYFHSTFSRFDHGSSFRRGI